MNFRVTAIIFGVTVALVVALLVLSYRSDPDEETKADDGVLGKFSASVKESEVDTVEIVRTEPSEQKLLFVKDGSKWELREPFRAKVNGGDVDAVVRALFKAKPTKYAELTDNLAIHGLDKPTVKVTLKQGASKSVSINLGRTTIGGSDAVTFISTGDSPNRPLAVKRSDLQAIFRETARTKDGAAWELARWLADYRVRRLLGADLRDAAAEAESVKLTVNDKDLALVRGPNGAWTFAAPAGYGEADDLGDADPRTGGSAITGVRPLLNVLTGLQSFSADDYIERPENLQTYGLADGDPTRLRVELKPQNGPPEVVFIGKAVEANGKPVMPSAHYCRLDGDSAVIKVQTDRVEALKQTIASPGDLRNKDLISPSKRDRIDAIDIAVGSSVVKLRRVSTGPREPEWLLYGGPSDPTLVKRQEVEMLLNDLAKPRAAREILAAPNDAAFAGPEVKSTVRVWFDGVEKSPPGDPAKLPTEPKLKGVPVELVFGKVEGDNVFVRRIVDGAKADLKLAAPALARVVQTRLDFIDIRSMSFISSLATRLTFNRGAEVYDIEKKDGSASGWEFAKPDNRKGKPADAAGVLSLLGALSQLYPDRVVAENPTPEALKQYGLDPAAPRMRATIALKDDPSKERAFEFGAETDDKKSVYARQANKPYVFLVPKEAFDKLASDDLRDTTLYRLDLAKVKKLKIRGWKGLVGPEPLVYQFEKQAAGWVAVAPTPAGFPLDGAKLVQLLAALSAPRADQFLGPIKPEYGLDPAAQAEAIQINIESDGAPEIMLLLGLKSLDPSRHYGAASGVPEAFTFTPGPIRSLTEKPTGLQP